MAFPSTRWVRTLVAFVYLLNFVCASSHVHRSPGYPHGRLAFRDELNRTNSANFNNPTNSTNSTNLPNSGENTNSNSYRCEFSPDAFAKMLAVTCQSEVEAIQACENSAMDARQRRELAKKLSACAVTVYQNVNSCAVPVIPTFGLPPFESDNRLGAMATYLNPLSDRILGRRAAQESKDCKKPDIIPIFERAITPFHNDTDGRWLAVEKTPSQYLRCTIQVPDDMVESCVTSSIHKLQWLPNRLIIYGGQKTCSTRVQLMVMAIIIMVMEAVHLVAEIWWTRRKRKVDPDYGRSFSWVGLFRQVIAGIGTPLVCALIVRTQFPENSLAAALGLYLLTPRAAPIIASISGIFLSKGFGTQTLLVDLVSAGGALVLYNLPLKVWNGPMSIVKYNADAPSTTFLYLGLYLATIPAGVVFFIYQFIIVLAVFLLIWSMLGKNKGLAKAAGYLVGVWLIMWIWIFSFAIFAIMEVVWLAFYKKKNGGKFPVLENIRGWFSSGLGHFLKRYGYWTWVIISFTVAVGRWMFFNELLQLTGGAFCPESLKGATAASILMTWGAIVANVLLKIRGLAL